MRHPLGILVGDVGKSGSDPVHDTGDLPLFRPAGFAAARPACGTAAPRRGADDAMNFSAPFIARPIATTLLAIGLALAGGSAFFLLPVSPLPNVDYPTISVTASLPGASPETVSTSVATPLERHLGTIAGVMEMTSSSSVGQTRINLQFDLDRDINGAARDAQAAINAARVDLRRPSRQSDLSQCEPSGCSI